MASQIFIAHTEGDRQTAAMVCAALERNGIRGWFAFRDVPMGMDPRMALFQAIDASAVCVLILSPQTDNAALAEQVNRAMVRELPLIALQLAGAFPAQELADALRSAASVYAGAIPSEAELSMLVQGAQSALSRTAQRMAPIPPVVPGLPPMSEGSNRYAPPPVVPPVVPPIIPPVVTPSGGYGQPNYSGSGYTPPPGATYVPNTTPTAPFQSIAALGWCVVVLLGASFLLDMAGAVFGLLQVHLLARMSDPAGFSMAEATRNDHHVQLVGILQLVTLASTAIFLLAWMYRAYKNLPALGAQGLTLSPGWAAGGFFVPFLNLVRPYQAMSEIWRASDPRSPQEDPIGWSRRSTSPLVGFWWGFWLCSGIAGSISFQLIIRALAADQQDRIEGLITGTWCQIVSDGLSLVTGILLVAIVLTISGWQEQRRKLITPQDLRAVSSVGALAPILTGFGLALLLGVTLMVVLSLQGLGTAWKEFTPPDSGFTVSMPGSPTSQTQPGDGITVYLYTSNDETAQYLSSYFDVAESGTPVNAAAEFDALEKVKADTLHGALAEEHDITVGGYHGRDFIVKEPQGVGTQSSRFQLVLVGVRVFQLMMMGDEETLHGANADKFFKSLAISYQPPAAVWQEFSPPGKEFTVLMPGTPTLQTQTDGGVIITIYVSSDGQTQYITSHFDANSNVASDPAGALANYAKVKAEGSHATLSEEKEITQGSNVGREFVLRNVDGENGQVMRFRVFVAGPRIFQLIVEGDDTAIHNADADKFFSSIHTDGM